VPSFRINQRQFPWNIMALLVNDSLNRCSFFIFFFSRHSKREKKIYIYIYLIQKIRSIRSIKRKLLLSYFCPLCVHHLNNNAHRRRHIECTQSFLPILSPNAMSYAEEAKYVSETVYSKRMQTMRIMQTLIPSFSF
jgi:hypothetical protein